MGDSWFGILKQKTSAAFQNIKQETEQFLHQIHEDTVDYFDKDDKSGSSISQMTPMEEKFSPPYRLRYRSLVSEKTTYTEDPEFEGMEREQFEVFRWTQDDLKKFDQETEIHSMYKSLVPELLTATDFWNRLIFKVDKLVKEMELLDHNVEENELTVDWGDSTATDEGPSIVLLPEQDEEERDEKDKDVERDEKDKDVAIVEKDKDVAIGEKDKDVAIGEKEDDVENNEEVMENEERKMSLPETDTVSDSPPGLDKDSKQD